MPKKRTRDLASAEPGLILQASAILSNEHGFNSHKTLVLADQSEVILTLKKLCTTNASFPPHAESHIAYVLFEFPFFFFFFVPFPL
jgi:hypothetical protein